MRCLQSKKIISLKLAAFFVCAFAMSAQAGPPEQIRFGLLPAEDPNQMIEQFSGISKHISKELGLPTSIKVSESYNALIEAMRSGHLEVVYVGGSQYVKMLELGMKVEPVVLNRDILKRTYYKSCIITKKGSGITSLKDLKDKTFAFVSPTSTSGGVAPTFMLQKNGFDPDKLFKRTMYAGKHDASFLAVKNGKVDAGAVGDVYFPRWKERGVLSYDSWDETNDRLINSEISLVTCQKVPNTPMVTKKDFGEKFIADLRKAFTSLPSGAASKYRVWPSSGFVSTSHVDFIDLIKMVELKKQIKAAQKKKKAN